MSDTGRSDSVTTWVRGTTSTWPLKTGRWSRNANTDSDEYTGTTDSEPATAEQNRHSATAYSRPHRGIASPHDLRLRDVGDPRGPGARAPHWRGGASHLPDLHVRPGRRRLSPAR